MQLSSCEFAEAHLVNILPLWLMSEMDAVDGGNNQFQIGKKCGNFCGCIYQVEYLLK